MRALALALGRRPAGAERIAGVAHVAARVPDLAAMADMVAGGVTRCWPATSPGERDRFDAAIDVLARNRAGAPVAAWGLWVLVRAVLRRPAADEARDLRGARTPSIRGTNRAGLLLRRGGDRRPCRATPERRGGLMAEGDAMLAAQHWWRRLLRLLVWRAALADGWGDPVAGLRADLAGFEASGDRVTARRGAGPRLPRPAAPGRSHRAPRPLGDTGAAAAAGRRGHRP